MQGTRRHSCALLTVVALGALAAVARAAQPDDPVAAYAGKYAGTDEFKSRFAALEEHRKRALAKVMERLGISPDPKQPIRIEIRDALPAEPERIVRHTGPAFQVTEDDEDVRLVIFVEFVMNGRHDLGQEVTHELTHAVQRSRMGRVAYRAIPKWLREGLAMWVADQGEGRVEYILTSETAWDDPMRLFPGLESGEHDLSRYAENALAFEFLLRKGGAGAPKRLVALLEAGKRAHDAVAEVTGLPWPTFRTLACAHALERVAAMRPPEWERFLAITAADRKRDFAEARRLAEEFLASKPTPFLEGDALYWHAKACRITKAPDVAVASLERLLAYHRATSGFVDDGLFQRGALEEERDRWEEAANAYRAILRDHPYSAHLDRAVVGLARCALERKQDDEARRWVELFERSFPESPVADDLARVKSRLAE